MIYRRRTYKVLPEHVETFNNFFHEYLLPNQLKNGARLVGRWVNEVQTEITAIWEYNDMADYERIQTAVRGDEMHGKAQARRKELGEFFLESKEEWLEPTGQYQWPKHIVTAAGYITNAEGDVLLVRTHWRADTWELPGGQVDSGETPDQAVIREVLEETGIEVELHGVTGVYYNQSNGMLHITFRGVAVGGGLKAEADEVLELGFKHLDANNVSEWITRPQTRMRAEDAMKGKMISYEAFRVRPYELIKRYENN